MISKTGHRLYIISLWLKVSFAIVECISGLAIYFVSLRQVRSVTSWIMHFKVFADPHDRKTEFMQHLLAGLPLSAKTFISLYLLLHGLLKVVLVIGLLSGKRWAYPVGLMGLGAFVLYQLGHWARHGGVVILILCAFDLFIMWMVWREWQEKSAH